MNTYQNTYVKSTKKHKQLKVTQSELDNLRSNQNISYKNNYDAKEAQTNIHNFFEIMDKYDSSQSYNDRRAKIEKSYLASINVTQSDLFKTDREETGEVYIDNNHMSSDFVSAKLYITHIKNGVLKGKVLEKHTITTKNSDTEDNEAIYTIEYDLPTNQITDIKYDYGVKGVENG
ncbi:hypothetical protein JOC36_000939 [Weissella uvarum]|uniref:hypothetical protein n=1 Tax=Weissella uvarum TaxID=1479233 RepID=UPI00195F4B5A|nr:hypothetical protein [Weissella uvarum]MBM7617382.1 hypothetical protein [Weissella uvarum]MCM0595732.1 hypothetical protein [Weissella uvarum]